MLPKKLVNELEKARDYYLCAQDYEFIRNSRPELPCVGEPSSEALSADPNIHRNLHDPYWKEVKEHFVY